MHTIAITSSKVNLERKLAFQKSFNQPCSFHTATLELLKKHYAITEQYEALMRFLV